MTSPDPSAAFRRLGNGGVILNVESSAYFQVNGSDRLIWKNLEGSVEGDDLIEAVGVNFDIDHERATADVDAFLGQPDERSLVDIGE